MKIRTKLLILLLVVSVAPLVGSAALARWVGGRLAGTLAASGRDVLEGEARTLLARLVEDYGTVLARDKLILEHAVQLQAREAERRLAGPVPPEARIYTDREFESADALPPGSAPSDRHFRPDASGKPMPIIVSFEEQVYNFVEGADRDVLRDDVRRLSTMPEAYRFARNVNPELITWQYTSMEPGLHTSFPAHGGLPDDYDPRERQWYRAAAASAGPVWVVMPDVSTRAVVVSVAMRVRRTDGSLAGVTGLDVPVTALFHLLELPEAWAPQATVMLVTPGALLGRTDGRAVVVADQRYESQGANWREPLELRDLDSPDADELAALLADAAAGRAGVRRLRDGDRDAIWAHGAGEVFPIVIVPAALVLARASEAEEYVIGQVARVQRIAAAIVTGLALLAVLVAVISARTVTRPARRLAEAAQRLAEGDYDARVEIRTRDEMKQLGDVFNAIGPQLRERERIKHSLALAMEVQQSLLPAGPPHIAGLEVAGHSTYCDETGGDYYDFLEVAGLSPDTLVLAVGDVMGHGIAAAMFMATARGVLRSRARAPGSLAELLDHMNELLVGDTRGKRFMTMLLLTINRAEGVLRWASAGHDPPIAYDAVDDRFIDFDGGGAPLGVMMLEPYQELVRDDVRAGQVYVLATDGVWEARNSEGAFYGKDRLRDVTRRNAAESAEIIAEAIRTDVAAFQGKSIPLDDVTFVVVKVIGP